MVNNVFYYDKYDGPNPSVYLGSRNGGRRYSDEDEDDEVRLYGSSVSDADFARYNVVMQNQIYKRSPGEMIRTGMPSVNAPNYVSRNEAVTSEIVRLAGCYVGEDHELDFIRHGDSVAIRGAAFTCNDGMLDYDGDDD